MIVLSRMWTVNLRLLLLLMKENNPKGCIVYSLQYDTQFASLRSRVRRARRCYELICPYGHHISAVTYQVYMEAPVILQLLVKIQSPLHLFDTNVVRPATAHVGLQSCRLQSARLLCTYLTYQMIR